MAKHKKITADEENGLENTATIILGTNTEALRKHLAERENKRPEVIREATIVDGWNLNVKWTVEIQNGVDTTTKKCSAPVHDDLRIAFALLNNHLAHLCFQPLTEHNPAHKENKELPALICPVHCIGFKLSGNGETEGVTLFGSRTLPNAKAISLSSPTQKWSGDIFEYAHSNELSEIIMQCVGEVELYLFEDKHAPDNQLSLFPEEEEDSEEEQD